MLVERRQVGVVFPQGRAGRAHVRNELAGAALVQVSHGCCEHHDIPGRLGIAEDKLHCINAMLDRTQLIRQNTGFIASDLSD